MSYDCKYADYFGKVGTGLHSYRVGGIAIVDLVLTVVAAYLFARYFESSFLLILVALLLTGIILHRMFCVRTTVDKLLFPHDLA